MPSTPLKTGLSREEAARRLAVSGPNTLPGGRRRSVGTIFLETLREPTFLLMLSAAVIYLFLGDLGEGAFLIGGVSLAAGLVIFQEARSERALAALRQLAEPFAEVIRDGRRLRVPASDLVPGDALYVGEGERLPADALLLAGEPLGVDESVITGESAAVLKLPHVPGGQMEAATLLAGSLVVRGQGLAEVTQTGSRTAFGRIGATLATIEEAPTPLQKTARRLTGVMGVAAIAICLLTVAAYGMLRGDWIAGALSGLTLSIALIPEEFPMVLAVFLALGAWRLARRRVLVRRPAVIEALGAASVLCVDKTGTLTENRMRLTRLWAGGAECLLGEPPPDGPCARLVQMAALASAGESTDPIDRAVLQTARPGPPALVLERTWPLAVERLAVVRRWSDGAERLAAAKGAPEAIFALCRLEAERLAVLRQELDRMASEGLRVLAVASCTDPEPANTPEALTFVFEGFLGFLDPVRADAPAALAEARSAGIAVVMITGDYPATALAIARQAGIRSDGVVTGEAFAAMTPAQQRDCVGRTRVFARVQPDQKLLLVRAFQADGALVAMTGDGVNDAPALEAADIGIAMGTRGSDVAREASDIVLLDDDFASLVGGVRLGRRIFANLRKALIFITAIHVPIAGLALAPVLMGLPPMLAPMHLVLLELVIDPVCSLVFEAEPSGRRAMRQPPRRPGEPIFGLPQGVLAVLQGVIVFVAVLALYWSLSSRLPEAEARACGLVALVVGNLALALSDSATTEVGALDRSRALFWLITAAALAVLALVLFTPGLKGVFAIAPPPVGWLLASAATGLAAGGWFGVGLRLRAIAARNSSPP